MSTPAKVCEGLRVHTSATEGKRGRAMICGRMRRWVGNADLASAHEHLRCARMGVHDCLCAIVRLHDACTNLAGGDKPGRVGHGDGSVNDYRSSSDMKMDIALIDA